MTVPGIARAWHSSNPRRTASGQWRSWANPSGSIATRLRMRRRCHDSIRSSAEIRMSTNPTEALVEDNAEAFVSAFGISVRAGSEVDDAGERADLTRVLLEGRLA